LDEIFLKSQPFADTFQPNYPQNGHTKVSFVGIESSGRCGILWLGGVREDSGEVAAAGPHFSLY
jgi:hypothetical protein